MYSVSALLTIDHITERSLLQGQLAGFIGKWLKNDFSLRQYVSALVGWFSNKREAFQKERWQDWDQGKASERYRAGWVL